MGSQLDLEIARLARAAHPHVREELGFGGPPEGKNRDFSNSVLRFGAAAARKSRREAVRNGQKTAANLKNGLPARKPREKRNTKVGSQLDLGIARLARAAHPHVREKLGFGGPPEGKNRDF